MDLRALGSRSFRRPFVWLVRLVVVGALLISMVFLFRFSLFRIARGLPAYRNATRASEQLWVTMRDGVRLRAEVHRPAAPDKAPTILIRNPYNMYGLLSFDCEVFARFGFACVVEDVRGRGESEGEWLPFRHEREDGLDTLQWLVAQPFVDGNIALWGPSYLASTQWVMADALPPQVKTMIPMVFGSDFYSGLYERGLFRHDLATLWAALMPERGGMTLNPGPTALAASRYNPGIDADDKIIGHHLPWYREWVSAPAPGAAFWQSKQVLDFAASPAHTHVPVLMVGGFFEPFFFGQMKAWQTLASQSESVWMVGPWNHLGLPSGDYPIHGAGGGLDQWPLVLEWLDHTLRGAPLQHLHPGMVSTFAPGDSQWRVRPSWPELASIVDWHLADAPAAQACSGGALLPAAAPLSETKYSYDPLDPTPTRGGASLLSFVFARTNRFTAGPVEQGESCERKDVLTWKSAPLATPARLSGAASLDLTVRSSAPDTAFVARLILEQGERAYLVREGAATLSLPTAQDVLPRVYVPDSDASVRIDFWPIEWAVPAGARWRVDITSSSFPALHAHSNRAGPWAEQTGSDVAEQTVKVGGSRAVLHLPLVVN